MQKVTSFQGHRYLVIGEWIGIGFWCPGPKPNLVGDSSVLGSLYPRVYPEGLRR